MSDVSLDVFLPDIMPFVRDCPELVARQAVRNALIEFCNKSQWWLDDQYTLSVVTGQNNYELDPVADTDVVTLAEVRYNGRLLVAKSPDQLDAMFNQDWRSVNGDPRYYTRIDPAEIVLVPCPQSSLVDGLALSLILRPSRDAAFVSEEFYRRWSEEIGLGARARLHEIPNYPFSDATLAATCRARFNNAINLAIIERNQGQTRGPIAVTFGRFV